MTKDNKQSLIALKKAKSLIEKIIEMVENDNYCIDIIQQNLAAIGLIKSSNVKLLEGHLSCCFADAAKNNDIDTLNEMIGEITNIVKTAQNK